MIKSDERFSRSTGFDRMLFEDLFGFNRVGAFPVTFWLFAFGFAVCWIAINSIKPFALRLDLVDHPGGPGGRKTHAAPTPVIGGIGIAIAVALGLGLTALVAPDIFDVPLTLLAAMAIIAMLGGLDDRMDLPKLPRFVIQIVVGCLVALAAGITELPLANFALETIGLSGVVLPEGAIVLLLGVAICGLINAVNWLDGADGLLGSLTLVALVFAGYFTLHTDLTGLILLIVVTAGAVMAFLTFNLRWPGRNRATVFLGDAGSGLLAVVLAYLMLTLGPVEGVDPLVMLLAGNLLFFGDMLFVMGMRFFRHGRIWKCDRLHLHHRLTDRGFQVNEIVLIACSTHALFLTVLFGLADTLGALPVFGTLGLMGATVAIISRNHLQRSPAFRDTDAMDQAGQP